MPKRTMFTNITPLPPQVSREVAIAMLHNHDEMIELNPLVIEHHPIKTPRDAPADEFLDCVWQELTDKIHFLPGGIVKGKVTYRGCFHDIPDGLQTHIYAPMGLDIREKWSVGGSLPGHTPEPRELGVNTPHEGLYLREDCDIRCNIMLTGFVRKNLDNAHKVLVERLLKKAERVEQHLQSLSPTVSGTNVSLAGSSGFQRGSHMAQSRFINSPREEAFTPPLVSPERDQFPDLSIHPAFRNDPTTASDHAEGSTTPPPYRTSYGQLTGYPQDIKQNPYQQDQGRESPPQRQEHPMLNKEFAVELPGSAPKRFVQRNAEQPSYRESVVSELSDTDALRRNHSVQQNQGTSSDGGSEVSEPLQTSNGYIHQSSQQISRNGSYSQTGQQAELRSPSSGKPTFHGFHTPHPESYRDKR